MYLWYDKLTMLRCAFFFIFVYVIFFPSFFPFVQRKKIEKNISASYAVVHIEYLSRR